MKPLALNLSKMKKVASDKDSSVFQHPDGHQIKVAHAPLSALQRKQIEKMPVHHFDEGGSVNSSSMSDSDNGNPSYDKYDMPVSDHYQPSVDRAPASFAGDVGNAVRQSVSDTAQALGDTVAPIVGAGKDFFNGLLGTPAEAATPESKKATSAPASDSAKQPASQTPNPTNPSAMPSDPFAGSSNQMNAAFGKEKAAIQAGANAESAAAANEAKAYGDYSQKLDAMQTPQQIFQNHQKADQDLLKAYMSKSIDPDHYWHTQSTGQKIAGALGMILGGVGAAHGMPNYAAQNINNAIAQDIESQKNDQSKSMNLWKMNREATQDEMQANLLTENQMLTAVKAKALQYQTQAAGPQAQARAAQIIAPIEQQIAANNMKRALLTGGSNGSLGNIAPEKLVPMLVPAEHQKQAFTELGQAKAAVQSQDEIKKLFWEAAKDTRPLTGVSGTSVMNAMPGYHPPSVKALLLLGDPLIHDNEGRINEFEKKDFMMNLPQFGDSDGTVSKKWEAMQNFINHKKEAPTANAYGINPENYATTSSNPLARVPQQYQGYARWALQNRNDPKAKIVLQKLGIQ